MTLVAVDSPPPPKREKPRLRIRSARADEGETIKRLVSNASFPAEMAAVLDWSNIEHYWLVADESGTAVGCLQCVVAMPIGRLEYLGYDEALTHPQRARVIKALMKAGLAIQKRAGVQLVSCVVPFPFKSWKRALTKRGAVVTAQGNVLMQAT